MPGSTQRSMPANSTKVVRELAPYMTLGVQLCITVVAFVALGWYVDERNGTSPLWIGSLGGVGAMVALVNLIRSLNSIMKKTMRDSAVHTTISNEEN